jgi:uncharacterized protein (UPF0548 family)
VEGRAPEGVDEQRFEREVAGPLAQAARALRGWAAHQGIGARPHPPRAELAEGTTLLVVAPFGPLEMAVPNRIVAVVDEPARFGFAYGTLAGHDEVGEELFLAEAVAPGRLRLSATIHARPGSRPARAVGPLVTLLSHAAARRYLEAWAAAVAPA